ncbi:MAG: phenylacetate--CoA ligase family protein [Pseudomonadales bacterium]|nr:phenylacetate--CoA ligase family protein [Pseudomonadales bacterium]
MAINLEGYRIAKRRYSPRYDEMETRVFARSTLGAEELEQYQSERLSTQFTAGVGCDYWRQKFAEFGVNPDAEDPLLELRKLPVLTKRDVQSHGQSILNPTYKKTSLILRHTSGTTGSGLFFYETIESELETWATWWRYRNHHGISRDSLCGYFGGRSIVPIGQDNPPYWRFNQSAKQIYFSSYHLNAETSADYLCKIAGSGVRWVHGYPSFLALLASFVTDLNRNLCEGVEIVSFGAESLTESHKSKIRTAFPNAELVQHYGLAEGVANISQCRHGSLHVDEDFSIVEFLPIEDMPGKFRIIGTNIINDAFPLFRYDTGDVVELTIGARCTCGSTWRVVGDIDGRIEDYVTLPNGTKVGRLDHVFKDMTNIIEAQIRQESISEIDVYIVPASSFSDSDEAKLKAELLSRLGAGLSIRIFHRKKLDRTKAGKARLVVSNL